MPKFPTQDPNHRILRAQRSRFTHYYFYLRDETLGPMVIRRSSISSKATAGALILRNSSIEFRTTN